ncbi:hypothetical protein F0562_006148 [Nyssa sinensis]|uniref:BHLH domain-containing protein n=1 Tax=Nyssa sinensis TaxID=561372 RepID=A0A5J5AMP5_9ASTE|nr:hypothetical protein F0562_006148 [Nyssa sinensis]
MEDPIFIHQCEILDSFEEELAAALGEDFQNSISSESNSSSPTLIPRSSSTTTLCASYPLQEAAPQVVIERPAKQQKPNSYNSCTINNMPAALEQPSSSAFILSFGNSNLTENTHQVPLRTSLNPEDEAVSDVFLSQATFVSPDEPNKGGQGTKRTSNGSTRPPSQTYDHIMAERKRREQLSQRFVALSAIVPGLKKMDKTSVLGEAIKYMKQLQERVKTLEEQSTKQTMESVVFVKKSHLLLEDDACSSDENFAGGSNEPLPEIEARVCDKNVLLRIHCEKRKGILVKVLAEIEKLNLAVINTSVSPFGTLALDITIIAEMEKEFSMTVKDLVTSLRSVLRRFMQTA